MMGMMTMLRVLPDDPYNEIQRRIRERTPAAPPEHHHHG